MNTAGQELNGTMRSNYSPAVSRQEALHYNYLLIFHLNLNLQLNSSNSSFSQFSLVAANVLRNALHHFKLLYDSTYTLVSRVDN